MLGACLVGVGGVLYLALGRLGLLLIGVLVGVVAHAIWENSSGDIGDEHKALESRRRRETGLDVVSRVLHLREKKRGELDEQDGDGDAQVDGQLSSQKPPTFAGFPPETAAALNSLVDAVIRDYVAWVRPTRARLR